VASRRLKILFSGMIAADPYQGGATWAVLQYLLGLRRLGHNVMFVEPVRVQALRPEGTSLRDSTNVAYFDSVMQEFHMEDRGALLLAGTEETVGIGYDELRTWVRSADLLINVSGMLADPALIESIPRRVYFDLDPAFIQLWQAVCGVDMRFAAHTHFVTVGLDIGTPDCTVPTCGREWITTVQPIVLEEWPVAYELQYDALTTIANWRGYGSIEHEGLHYGQKAHSLRRFFELPRLTSERFALALSIHSGEVPDVAALAENGWEILDPRETVGSPAEYQRFIQGSKAEFGIAKSGYVASRCGWFSDRSLCYLASGRPVIAQQTGFSRYIPVGEGLFAFNSADEVLAAIEALRRDYPSHARAARRLAEEHFDSDKVLSRLLEQTDR
jgi:hypothetical protein